MASTKLIFIAALCILHSLDARPVGEATSSDHQKAARRHGPLHRLLTKADALEVTDSAKITMEPAEEDSWELVEVDSEPLPNYYNSGVDRSQEDPSYQLLLKANEPKVTVTMTFMDRAELPDSSADSPAMLPASVTITIEPPEEEFEAFIVTSDSPSYNYKSSVEVSEESLHHFRRPRYCHHSVYPEQEDDVYYTKPRYC